MDRKTEDQKTYEILSACDDMCYAGKWKEIIELGTKLLADPEATPSMLLMWVCNGKFTAYHGGLEEEYTKILRGIDERFEKELGRERTDKLLKSWKEEYDRWVASGKPNSLLDSKKES